LDLLENNMKIYTEKEKIIKTKKIKDVVCNKCGESMYIYVGNNISEYYKGTEACLSFEYGSNKDGESYKFDICDNCFDSIIKTFKHVPEVIEW